MKTTYKKNYFHPGTLKRNKSVQGETIEQKVERMVNNKEPIKDGAPLIYTERKEGIRASTNIRTDRWEVAVDASDKIAKSFKARREEKAKSGESKAQKANEPESTQGKDPGSTDKS